MDWQKRGPGAYGAGTSLLKKKAPRGGKKCLVIERGNGRGIRRSWEKGGGGRARRKASKRIASSASGGGKAAKGNLLENHQEGRGDSVSYRQLCKKNTDERKGEGLRAPSAKGHSVRKGKTDLRPLNRRKSSDATYNRIERGEGTKRNTRPPGEGWGWWKNALGASGRKEKGLRKTSNRRRAVERSPHVILRHRQDDHATLRKKHGVGIRNVGKSVVSSRERVHARRGKKKPPEFENCDLFSTEQKKVGHNAGSSSKKERNEEKKCQSSCFHDLEKKRELLAQ